MAFTTCSVATNNVAALDDLPNDVGGLTPAELKAVFDKFGVDLVAFLNTYTIAEGNAHEADTAPHSNVGVPVILSSTGQKIQKGQTTITASGGGIITNVITFPTAFANAPLVFVTLYDASNTGGYITIWAANPSTTAFTLAINVYAATSLGISWMAIGS